MGLIHIPPRRHVVKPRPWAARPWESAAPDLWRGLSWAIPLWPGGRELIQGGPVELTNGLGWRVGPLGDTPAFDSTGNQYVNLGNLFSYQPDSEDFTMWALIRFDTTQNGTIMAKFSQDSDQRQFNWQTTTGGGFQLAIRTSAGTETLAGTMSQGEVYFVAVRNTPAGGYDQRIYDVNGRLVGATDGHITLSNAPDDSALVTVGGHPRDFSAFTGDVYLAGTHARALNDAELLGFAADPFAPFRQRERVYFPGADLTRTLGNNTIGASAPPASTRVHGSVFTEGASPVAYTKMYVYTSNAGSGDFQGVIYSDDAGVPGSPLATSNVFALNGTHDSTWVELDVDFTSEAGATYWLLFQAAAATVWHYDGAGASDGMSDPSAGLRISAWPDPFPWNGDEYVAREYSVYLEGEVAAVGGQTRVEIGGPKTVVKPRNVARRASESGAPEVWRYDPLVLMPFASTGVDLVEDVSGRGNHGTALVNDATSWAVTERGPAYYPQGGVVAREVRVADNWVLGGVRPITIGGVVDIDEVTGVDEHVIAAQWPEVVLRIIGGQYQFLLNSFSTNDRVTGGTAVAGEQVVWGRFDGVEMSIWVNGEKIAAITPTGTYANTTVDLEIGCGNDADQFYNLKGKMLAFGLFGAAIPDEVLSRWTLADPFAPFRRKQTLHLGTGEAPPGGSTGDGAITLGAITVEGEGRVPRSGAGAITLGSIQTAGTGTVPRTGSGAVTLGSIQVAGTQASPANAGAGDVTLGAIQIAGAGRAPRTGDGAIALDAITVAGAGRTRVRGDGSVTLGAIDVVGSGVVPVAGAGAVVLASVLAGGEGRVAISGAGALTLGSVFVSGRQTPLPPPAYIYPQAWAAGTTRTRLPLGRGRLHGGI